MRNENKAPLLMLSHGQAFEKQSFYSLKENRHHTTSIPMLSGKRVLGSGYGWLVLVGMAMGDADCCLWNPETAETIQLPRLHESQHYNMCVLSKPPTQPDCLVLFNRASTTRQCICMVGDEELLQFSSIEMESALLVAISSFQGEIYGILNSTRYPDYEFTKINFLVGETTRTVEFKPLPINGKQCWECPQLWRGWITRKVNYLIEPPRGAPGELLLVTKMLSGVVVEFRVFRVRLSEMKCSKELENIDGLTIFIGQYGNGFCCASETAGTKSNSIYYTTSLKGRVVRVYDLDDRSTTDLLPPSPVAHPHVLSVNHWVDLPASALCMTT